MPNKNEAQPEKAVNRMRVGRMSPREQCLDEHFKEAVRRCPSRIITPLADRYLTYGKPDRQSAAIAGHLSELHVGPDVLVGLSFNCNIEMVVGMLAFLKAGGMYLPIDVAYPKKANAMAIERQWRRHYRNVYGVARSSFSKKALRFASLTNALCPTTVVGRTKSSHYRATTWPVPFTRRARPVPERMT